jgi:sugar-specific transcriptional regulator TrmB
VVARERKVNMYENQLKELGLTDNEVRIYLVLLKHGLLTPYKLAEHTGLHRGYIYDSLERMQEKGIVNMLTKDKKKHFQATSPDNLVGLLELRLEGLKQVTPKLNKLMFTEKEETKIALHKGNRVWNTLLKDILSEAKKGDEILFVGIDETIIEPLEPVYLKRYFSIMQRTGWKEKAIIKQGGKRVPVKNIEYKEIDPSVIGNTTQIIYHNKVALFIAGTPYYLIIIENKEVANTYRKQFELLWKIARESKIS